MAGIASEYLAGMNRNLHRVILPCVRDDPGLEGLEAFRGRAAVLEQAREHLPGLRGKGLVRVHEGTVKLAGDELHAGRGSAIRPT